MSLYNDHDAFDALVANTAAACADRPADLERLDRTREQDPSWYRRGNMLGMTMYTDLLTSGLRKPTDEIPHLKGQKLTCLHLVPLLGIPHPGSDGGYAAQDFDTVDPKLGVNEDLVALAKKSCHTGTSLYVDFVMNHTASIHRWARATEAGDPECQDYYSCCPNRTIPNRYDRSVPQVFPNTTSGDPTWNERMDGQVVTQFYPFQRDLNHRNSKVLVVMMGSMTHLANLGVEVFHINAMPYVWKQLGINCRNLPQVHTTVRILRIVLECAYSAVVPRGEAVMAPRELVAYFDILETPECHMLYNISIVVNLQNTFINRDVRLLKNQIGKLDPLPEDCWLVNYLRCHGDIGQGLDGDVERYPDVGPFKYKEFLYRLYEDATPGSWSVDKLHDYDEATRDIRGCSTTASLYGIEEVIIACDRPPLEALVGRDLMIHHTTNLLYGFPMLNCGGEITQLNGWDYKEGPDRMEDGHNPYHSKFDWTKATLRKKPDTLQDQLWRSMEGLRVMRSNPCFAPDAWVSMRDTFNNSVLVVIRQHEGKTPVGLFNFSPDPQHAHLNACNSILNAVGANLQPCEPQLIRL